MPMIPDHWSSARFCLTYGPEHHQPPCVSGRARHFTFNPSLGFNSVTSDPQLRLALHLNRSMAEGPPCKLIYFPQFPWLKMMAPLLFCGFTVWSWALVINRFEHWPTAASTFPGGHICNWLTATQQSIRIKNTKMKQVSLWQRSKHLTGTANNSALHLVMFKTPSVQQQLQALTSPAQNFAWYWR